MILPAYDVNAIFHVTIWFCFDSSDLLHLTMTGINGMFNKVKILKKMGTPELDLLFQNLRATLELKVQSIHQQYNFCVFKVFQKRDL